MSQENYFLLLELDPSEKDLSRINKAIEKMQAKWSKDRNHPTKGRIAQKNLEQLDNIRKVMREDNSDRNEMARAAKAVETDNLKKVFQSLDELLAIFIPDGFINEIQLNDLFKKFKAQFSEKKIRERILSFKIAIKKTNSTFEKPISVIDKNIFKEICERLNFLKVFDLYSFLGLHQESKIKDLEAKAKQLYSEIQNVNNKTAEITAKQELLGHCLNLFKDIDGKEKYNNALKEAKLHELNDLIELSYKGGSISSKQMEVLVSIGAQKGISVSDSRQYIISFISKLSITQCNFCGHPNDKEERACIKCGKHLYTDCPKCNNLNAHKNEVCFKCGFSLSRAPEITKLIGEADFAISRGDMTLAQALLKKIEAICPDSSDMNRRLDDIAKIKKDQQKYLENINNALTAGKCLKGLELITELKQAYQGISIPGDIEDLLRNSVENARKNYTIGQKCLASGKTEEAYEYFSIALSSCKDFKDAQMASNLCNPAPPENLFAKQSPDGIILSWKKSLAKGAKAYEIARKIQSDQSPFTPKHIIGKVSNETFSDNKIIPGEIYNYGVYTNRDECISNTPTVVGPILYVSNVSELRVIPGNKTVSLEWEAPSKTINIEVWRNDKTKPKKRGDGKLLNSATLKSVSDTNLANGQDYGYLIVAVFKGTDGKPVYSDGASVITTPNELPAPVSHLTISRKGVKINISWSSSINTGVQIYNCINKPNYKLGDLMPISDLNKLGNRIPSLGPNSAQGNVDPNNLLHLFPVSIAGSVAVAGKPITLNWFDDISELKVSTNGNELFATWNWPQKSESALIAIRPDCFAGSHEDDKSNKIIYERYKYEKYGGYRVNAPSFKKIYITVFAIIKQGNQEYYASGCSEGARKYFPIGQYCALKYRISKAGKWFKPSNNYLLKITPSINTILPDIVLVAKTNGIPLDPNNGTIILNIPKGSMCSPDQPFEKTFKPPDDFNEKWRTRLFYLDEQLCGLLDIEEE